MSHSIQLLDLFKEFKKQCLIIKDVQGESPLFYAAREGDPEIFQWFSGHIDFFKARGDQNYKGQTIEHIVCMGQIEKKEIVDVIRPRPDTKDYYGNLPIFYSLIQNDIEMIKKYFKKGRDYFALKNYKSETIFHVCAKHNSLDSLKELIGRTVFIEELVKKDFKGDTPLHIAAKNGNLDILDFYMQSCSKSFLEIQNDFGFTVKEAIIEKIRLLEENLPDQNEETQDQIVTKDEGKVEKDGGKLEQLKTVLKFIEKFDNYITLKTWKDKFDMPMAQYFE